MILKLDSINTDYAIPFGYIKVVKVNYFVDQGGAIISYDCGNLDDTGNFGASREQESLHCTQEMVTEYFGKVSPEVDAFNILMARTGYKGEVI